MPCYPRKKAIKELEKELEEFMKRQKEHKQENGEEVVNKKSSKNSYPVKVLSNTKYVNDEEDGNYESCKAR